MVIEKVRNIVIGVRAEPGHELQLKLVTCNKIGMYETHFTEHRKYYHGTPINYPKVFSFIF